MTIIGKLIPSSTRTRKSSAARPEGVRAYRAEAVRLVSVARESGLRFQRQWVISFVAVVAMLALLAALYLNVTASASIAGRQIQYLEVDIVTNEQVNADLETQIATLMSNTVLEQRAEAMGFEPVDRTKLEYMVVPGYFPPRAVSMVSSAAPAEILANAPEFKETLIDWISKQIEAASIPLSEAKQ
jgi:uncharacterized protein involved in exopolysaccharide biosynthesis